MPHSRQDIKAAKTNYDTAADDVLAIFAGAMEAIKNGKRAANVLEIIAEEPLTLTTPPPARQPSIKDLAEKMGG